jgi:hypothetical protein
MYLRGLREGQHVPARASRFVFGLRCAEVAIEVRGLAVAQPRGGCEEPGVRHLGARNCASREALVRHRRSESAPAAARPKIAAPPDEGDGVPIEQFTSRLEPGAAGPVEDESVVSAVPLVVVVAPPLPPTPLAPPAPPVPLLLLAVVVMPPSIGGVSARAAGANVNESKHSIGTDRPTRIRRLRVEMVPHARPLTSLCRGRRRLAPLALRCAKQDRREGGPAS